MVLPHWTSTFTAAGGQQYSIAVLGSDPSLGQTTTIPTVIIPYRLVFSDGAVIDASRDIIDGTTPIDAIVSSPLFQSVPWTAGGEQLGKTQWGDAVLRANYWQQLQQQRQQGSQNAQSTNGEYHVLLGAPRVLPPVTVTVPADLGHATRNATTGRMEGTVDAAWMRDTNIAQIVAAGITPHEIPIHVVGEVGGQFLGESGFIGYHFAEDLSYLTGVRGQQVWIETGYFGAQSYEGAANPNVPGVGVLAHEIAETLNDPGIDNLVPGWERLDQPHICYSAALEVGDPLETSNPGFDQILGGKTYRFPDVSFTPWFLRTRDSFSVNGQYDLLNQIHAPSTTCKNPLYSSLYFPGRAAGYQYDQILTGVNNTKQAVGYLAANGAAYYGFTYGTFDPAARNTAGFSIVAVPVAGQPGYVWYSSANAINDAGVIVGSFTDSAGTHGFMLSGGQYTTLDFPGAAATLANGINSRRVPDVVGSYVDAAGASHGFVLRKGKYTTVDVPGATNTAVTGINDRRHIVGNFDTGSASHGFQGRFVRDDDSCEATLETLDYPHNAGDQTTQIATFLNAINGSDEVVGAATVSYGDGSRSTIGFFESGGSFLAVGGGSQSFAGTYVSMVNGINDVDLAVGLSIDRSGTLGEIWVPYSSYSAAAGVSGDTAGSGGMALTPAHLASLPILKP